MPRVSITHRTEYRYARPVGLGAHRVMVRPRETRDLRLRAFDLRISPAAAVAWSHDVGGNSIATATFADMTDMLVIDVRMEVELFAPEWPVFPIAASAVSYPFRYAADEVADLGLLASPRYADDAGQLANWVKSFVMRGSTDTLSLLKDIANGVTAQIVYESRESEGTQGPLETLRRERGSCRDFAVLFAEAARTLGFGVRLVSGYLFDRTGDQVGSAGDGSTHAWADVFVPGAGWIAFDPTNRSVGAANLVPVAVARSIEQVSPVSGSFIGTGSELLALDVKIAVQPA